MFKINEWSTKAKIRDISKKTVERNTGENIQVVGSLNAIFQDAVLITSQDITTDVNEIRQAFSKAIGNHIISKAPITEPIKGIFVEIVSTATATSHYFEAINASLSALPNDTLKCVSFKSIETDSSVITIWITH